MSYVKAFFIVNSPLILGSIFDSWTSHRAISHGYGVEVNPLYELALTSYHIFLYFGVLPLLASFFVLPALRLLSRVIPFLESAKAGFFTKTFHPDKHAQYAFLLATIPVAVGLAKLCAGLNNLSVLVIKKGFFSKSNFTLILIILMPLCILGSFYVSRAIFMRLKKQKRKGRT